MSLKSEVENILDKRWKGLKDPKELISLYNIEKQTNQGYNGRQLLELFQNCEDEGASKVKILLDTNNCLLEVSNDGNKPFSKKGYESIFYPGLSSKVSSGYIGNKGLGFRSIINWADEISIISNDFEILFNSAFKQEVLIDKVGYTEQELIELRQERKLKPDVYPIPLLNCCKVLDLKKEHQYTTTIGIKYKKEFEDSIISQLNSISSKTLLFLQNICDIEIDGDVIKRSIAISRKAISNYNYEIKYNGDTYFVLGDEGLVDDELVEDNESSEPKRYSVKIAYNNDLSLKDTVLYNYFKTQIPFELPFVVHASLELDQNRNHSTNSKVNPFILKKLFNLHLRLIEDLKSKNKFSWLPFLTVNHHSFHLYDSYAAIIDSNIDNIEVFPTLSGKYENAKNAKTLGNDFAKFIHENKLEKYCEKQVTHYDIEIDPLRYIAKFDNYKEIIEGLASYLSFNKRASLVKLILDNYPYEKFNVLLDEKGSLIYENDFIYTDKTSENRDLKVPNYSRIRFLHPELYQALINELGLHSEKQKSRSLKDRLERISDVHSFEPQIVTKKIISETSLLLEEQTTENQSNTIKQFYQVLFDNYNLRDEHPVLDYDSRIPCINGSGEIVDIKKLVLSQEFKISSLSKLIFKDIYTKDDTVANLSEIGLIEQDRNKVEEFLLWLGINHFSIISAKSTNINGQYLSNINRKNNVRITSYSLFSVKDLELVLTSESIGINELIVWLSVDIKINDIFRNFTTNHSSFEKLQYNYYGVKKIKDFKNYIYYKITQRFDIPNYLVTSKKEEWFNPFVIDYDYIRQQNKNLDKNEIDRILLFFGAKKDFNELDIAHLKNKNGELANRNNHKGAQLFYKKLVGHFKVNQNKILNANLYAKQGEQVLIRKANEIYFSDRIQLPKSLTTKFPILYYPSRSGGAMAIEMFGLNNLNDLDLKIKTAIPNEIISSDFSSYIKEVKPFILAFRLDKLTKEDVKKSQVQKLNGLKIVCCQKITCSLDEEPFEIEEYNYIFSDKQFFINIPPNESLFSLKKNKVFIDNMSDIFLKLFDTLDEKKIFESVLKQDEKDNIYDINTDLAEGVLEESKILLGEISIRLSIWRSIFKIKGIESISEMNDNNIEEYIYDSFPQLKDCELFNSDVTLDDKKIIRETFKTLDISLEEYNSISDYKLTFDDLFNKELNDYYENKKKVLKNQLWGNLKTKGTEKQSEFITGLYKIETLFHENVLSSNSSEYNFTQVITDTLKDEFPDISFDLENVNFDDYDSVEQENKRKFSTDELLVIKENKILNSLSYFEGTIDYIKGELLKKAEQLKQEEEKKDKIELTQHPKFINNFDVETNDANGSHSGGLWLGSNGELSGGQKKKLGNSVEDIVYKYLKNKTELYTDVDHIAKTNEGLHYDIKYYHISDKEIKYVECKYYNGSSFYLSREEKLFADNHTDQYEIWLVNKESKIFCIKNIKSLGILLPNNYKVNIKLVEHA